ncbi:probable Xaa-Pro aminopeptidase P [Belonocnema kinseyi]|uniref:probable Xaa-Pro aminopeptidase P n=1 Tax=Belonocnema kinseyi TaxID=2817044 RepID=UPI00143D1EBA|nr:probable Xaa-Pro aminopeptidase P [Belonocnema kinseyi]
MWIAKSQKNYSTCKEKVYSHCDENFILKDVTVDADAISQAQPGFYENGKFGIRLENIELIVKADTKYNFNNRGYLTFETVTLVPIQSSLLDIDLLSDAEQPPARAQLGYPHGSTIEISKPKEVESPARDQLDCPHGSTIKISKSEGLNTSTVITQSV